MKKIYLLLLITVIIYSCNSESKQKSEASPNSIEKTENSDYLLNATLWVQTSGEYRACCYQAFNYAKIAVENNLKKANNSKPPAVIFDLDETLIDNSFYEAYLIENKTNFTKETWKEWTDMSSACAIPGALDFLNFLKSKNIEIVYITNRKQDEIAATKRNLESLGFPEVDILNYYPKIDESNKDSRRQDVARRFNIILLVGDNLADFDSYLDERDLDYGFANVDELKEEFGKSFIILPNPMYGNWEGALYKDKNKSNFENKLEALKGYSQSCLK